VLHANFPLQRIIIHWKVAKNLPLLSPQILVNYNFEFKNSLDEVVASRYNVTGNLKMAYIGTGNYTMTITNLKESSLYFSLIKETFPLQTNSETKGYSYKTKLYCWSIDASQSNFHQYPIESLNRRDYFMYFISPEKPSTATVWFAYFNPQTNEDWAEYLEPLSIPGNWKIPVEITKDTNWLVVQLGSTGDFNVIIILRISSEFTLVGKVLVGIASAVVGVVIFVLYYFDPLKFRKRKVRGENYEKYKAQYERVENLQDAVKEVFSSVEEEKRKNK